jgi:trk system potassium uptake protein TrkH
MMSFIESKLGAKNFQFILACLLLIEGVSFLICSSIENQSNEQIISLLIPGIIAIATGILFFIFSEKRMLTVSDYRMKFIQIVFAWVAGILIGTIPYLTGNHVASFTDALFESVSGFTLTGSSVFQQVDQLPRSIVLWRSLSHWIGGFGTILMVVQVFPFLNIFGNISHSSCIYTHDNSLFYFRKILFKILIIYSILTVTEVGSFYFAGIGFFNSVCYGIATVSSGCFSPESSGITAYSPLIQYLLVAFMGISGIGYFTFILIASGRIGHLRKKNDELKLYGLILLSTTFILTIIFFTNDGLNAENSFRSGLFQAVSFLSSSGFTLTNIDQLPDNVLLILMLLAVIGGCLGSTSGGIKVNRLSLILKNIKRSVTQLNLSGAPAGIRFNQEIIDEKTNISVLLFVAIVGIITVFGILGILLTGISLSNSVLLVVTAITNTGHNLDIANSSALVKITLSLFMLLGRLDIYPLLIFFLPSFYKRNNAFLNK